MAGMFQAPPGIRCGRSFQFYGGLSLADIGVVYLCRFADGEAAVRTFVQSYRAHAAGVTHDLHGILKGFPDLPSLASARALFAGLPVNFIELEDIGYDIGSYFAATKVVSDRRLIFFNTFTELLADDWLKKFDTALSLPGVGIVSATGSWQSLSSYYEVLVRLGWHEIGRICTTWFSRRNRHTQDSPAARGLRARNGVPKAASLGRGLYLLLRLDRYLRYLYQYGRYPNPHVRSNAFMIERDRFLSLHPSSFEKKIDAYRFESGRQSMTKQIIAQGLRPVLMDRNGCVYDISEWESSSTYWVDQQANLIAADNRTRQYEKGSQERRRRLQDYAWVHPASWTLEVHRARLIYDQP
jgi:hypothetical protein